MTVEVAAPAKINLALHVTGLRSDGYHLLDTMVAFAGIGDRITLSRAPRDSFAVTGPEAAPELNSENNIMWRVVRAFWPDASFAMTLEKNLPVASGIGGGSADAAAVYRAVLRLRALHEGRDAPRDPAPKDAQTLLGIGADVPMCVPCTPARVRGIGEQIVPVAGLHPYPVVLVNPRVQVSTAAIFNGLITKDNPPLGGWPDDFEDRDLVLDWLARQRNDLEGPAVRACPVIAQVLAALGSTGDCRLARMSGSGATCFGLFDKVFKAEAAAEVIRRAHP